MDINNVIDKYMMEKKLTCDECGKDVGKEWWNGQHKEKKGLFVMCNKCWEKYGKDGHHHKK